MAGVGTQNGWSQLLKSNPGHSQWYVDRFRSLARDGADLDGEARLVDAMLPRTARVLDAGCGPGRVGAALAAAGHDVVGVDLDPVLIDAARQDHPGPRWLVGDLAELDLPAQGITDGFDAIVSAGNVMTFLAPDTRQEVLRRMRLHLRDGGRIVVGFGTDRGYPVTDFLADMHAADLVEDLLLATWDLRPYRDDSDFLVAVLRPA
ncbi:class I SAM-dependent methyltransferase [Micromonospora sp. LOL_021]|uniref:class I SAM-dependent methyltransferase n=1 Tax=Micromonospora sp. LOL_021 TaxID=3345417 RepID=UPI003A880F9C